MLSHCPRCSTSLQSGPGYVRRGRYWRVSDGRWLKRYRCRSCQKGFSQATTHECYQQKKRQFNKRVFSLLVSGVSQRRAAQLLNLNRTTVVRKFLFLAEQSRLAVKESLKKFPQTSILEFDDLETFEHSKMKPLSVTLAVEFRSRRILGFSVSKMPCKGRLAKRARAKYGPRVDERAVGRRRLFETLQPLVSEFAEIKSDESPHYPRDVKKYFPNATHIRFKGVRGAVTGQGELKKIKFDPLFSLNHTCAMFRANINRLFRKTWCTTKKSERLTAHIWNYVHYHNEKLESVQSSAA